MTLRHWLLTGLLLILPGKMFQITCRGILAGGPCLIAGDLFLLTTERLKATKTGPLTAGAGKNFNLLSGIAGEQLSFFLLNDTSRNSLFAL